jgi:hypothetical protein
VGVVSFTEFWPIHLTNRNSTIEGQIPIFSHVLIPSKQFHLQYKPSNQSQHENKKSASLTRFPNTSAESAPCKNLTIHL